MGIIYDEDEEEFEAGLTENQAQRIVEWVTDHGHTKEEAYEALAYVMGVNIDQAP